MPQYDNWKEIHDAADYLVNSRRPFKFTWHDLASFSFVGLPVKKAISFFVAISLKEDETGMLITIDWTDFQDLTWEPVEVNDIDWQKYLDWKGLE